MFVEASKHQAELEALPAGCPLQNKDQIACGPLAYPGWCCYGIFSLKIARATSGSAYDIRIVNKWEHGPRISINNKCLVELVRPLCCLCHGHRCIGSAELWRRFVLVTQVLSPFVQRSIADWSSESSDGCQNSCEDQWRKAHVFEWKYKQVES